MVPMCRVRAVRWALLWTVGVAGCQPPVLPDAEITGIAPSRVWRGTDVPVTIEGRAFFPGVEVDARGFGSDLDRDWEAFLVRDGDRHPLLAESLENDEELRALVPAGFEPGEYTVGLVSPSDREVFSDVVLEVTDSQEAAFSVSYLDDPGPYVVGDVVSIVVQAVGLDNERVFTDVPVEVELAGVAAQIASTGTFQDAQLFPGGKGFTAVLRNGSASLTVDLQAPGRLDVVAESPPDVADLQSDALTMVVGGGSSLPATVEVPADIVDGGVAAGVPFDVTVTVRDELGEVVEEPLPITLRNGCGGYEADVIVRGPTPIEVVLERSTFGDRCDLPDDDSTTSVTGTEKAAESDDDEDYIYLDRGGVGVSESFPVRGGDAARFDLLTLGLDLEAGVISPAVIVEPKDAYDNPTSWSGTLTVTDDLGSLTDVTCIGVVGFLCRASPTIAGEDVTITVEGDDGLTDSLPGFRFLPSSVADSLQVEVPHDVRAGLPVDVEVEVFDAFGNRQLPEQVDAAELAFSTELDDADCTLGGVGADGVLTYSCMFTVARSGGEVVVTGSGSMAGIEASASLSVDNGYLSQVEIDAPATVVAGTGFALSLTGSDAFGNPYIRQDDPVLDDPVVDLTDGSETVSPQQALLGPGGTATVATTLSRSGSWTIDANQGGILLGSSDPVVVTPAATSALSVAVDAPWGEVGIPVDVVVEAVDAYGNRTALSESLTVSSKLTSTPDEVLVLVNGVASVSWAWTQRAVAETLLASSASGFEGESEELFVVRDCGVDGPQAEVLLGGATVGLACYDEVAGTAALTADLSGSSAGDFPVVGYGVALDGPAQVSVVGASDVVDVELTELGRYEVRAIAVDADACAHEITTDAYVGLDDGSPTGPVPLVPVDLSLPVSATTSVDVLGVTDCAGDPAGGAELLVRASGGELGGVSATGAGLAITLDLVGDGSFDLTTDGALAENGPTGGELMLAAKTGNGSALGSAAVSVTGDAMRPTILDQQPRGLTTGLVDTVVLEVSEALLPSSVESDPPVNFTLTGPSVVDIVDAQLVDTTITLTLSPPADADAGAWLLTVSDNVRDTAGNRLSGDWSGARSDYTGAFGDVGAVPAAVTCPLVVPSGGFRPDGDDGVGVEADEVEVSIESLTAPAWWVVDVTDELGALVVQDWAVPAGAVDAWSWDGRDAAGFVVPAGTYTLFVRPDDGFGNRGAGCVVQTVVEHPFEEP